jgi:hypothetical protein
MNHLNSTTTYAKKSSPPSSVAEGGAAGGKEKQRRYTYHIHHLEAEHCYTCPLDDCVGTNSPRCPIFKARAQMQSQAAGQRSILQLEVAA